jgi:site-specific DNA-methyltransferase (adenine-specific)
MTDVPVITVDLTDEQANAYRLADNKLNESEWDMKLVIEELKGLSEPILELTGFDKDLIIEPDEQDDVVPDVPEEPQSKLGDLYELGEHRVLCGDSTSIDDVEKLMDGKKADMVFTDPPYGVDYDGGHAEKGKRREKLESDDETDMYAGSLPLAYAFSNDSAPLYLWFADRFARDVLNALGTNSYQVRSWIIWNKNLAQFGAIGAQYKTKHEPVIYAFKKGKAPTWNGITNEVTVWDVDRHSKNEFHPTQKPTALCERAIRNHLGTEAIILDLFLGSGSTLIASQKTGRICYGMELDPKYIDVIVQRYVDYTGNTEVVKNGKIEKWEKTMSKTK